MASELEISAVTPVPAAPAMDKSQVIMDLVSALDAFDAATPVTGFPEKMADKAKAARALSAELKDDLLLLKQHLEEAGKDLSKVQTADAPTFAPQGEDDGADLGRFASLVNRLDSVANQVQDLGLRKLAAEIDIVTNTLIKTK